MVILLTQEKFGDLYHIAKENSVVLAYYKELTDVDVRGQMFTEQQNAIEADMAPFGFIDNGLDDPEGRNNSFYDDSGVLWNPVSYHRGEN